VVSNPSRSPERKRTANLASFSRTPVRPSIAEDVTLLRPVGLIAGKAAQRALQTGFARPLAGGPLAFTALEIIGREKRSICSVTNLPPEFEAQLAALAGPRPVFAGLTLDRPRLMGIVNATPDSFSDGGAHSLPEAAVRHGSLLLESGADFIDVGGESTRPGAEPVSREEQIRRIEPVVRALADRGVLVSIDTRDPGVMEAAFAAGAQIVNDISALAAPGAIEATARAGTSAILVHMQGDPRTMQEKPHYENVTIEVVQFLASRIADCAGAGIPAERLAIDPGIGFGKTGRHNAQLLDELAVLHVLSVPVVLGASRKGWIGALETRLPSERIGGSLAAALAGLDRGAQILRVHDVAQTRQALEAWERLNCGPRKRQTGRTLPNSFNPSEGMLI
jgi:dihydropteroate synthase